MQKNKTVVITAGHRGMGEVIALRYASSGANIAILANRDSTAIVSINTHAVAEKIMAAGRKRARFRCQCVGCECD